MLGLVADVQAGRREGNAVEGPGQAVQAVLAAYPVQPGMDGDGRCLHKYILLLRAAFRRRAFLLPGVRRDVLLVLQGHPDVPGRRAGRLPSLYPQGMHL